MNMIVLEIPLKNPTTRYSAFMLHVALSSTHSWQNPLERIALFLKVQRHRYKIHGLQPTTVE